MTDNQLFGSGGVQLLDSACEKEWREPGEAVFACISLHYSSMFWFMKDLVGTEKVRGSFFGVWDSIDET